MYIRAGGFARVGLAGDARASAVPQEIDGRSSCGDG